MLMKSPELTNLSCRPTTSHSATNKYVLYISVLLWSGEPGLTQRPCKKCLIWDSQDDSNLDPRVSLILPSAWLPSAKKSSICSPQPTGHFSTRGSWTPGTGPPKNHGKPKKNRSRRARGGVARPIQSEWIIDTPTTSNKHPFVTAGISSYALEIFGELMKELRPSES